MSGSIRQQTNVLISGAWSRENIAKIFAKEARRLRDEAITSGKASRTYTTVVDGKVGGKEEDTKIGGQVWYLFNDLANATSYAFIYATARSPRKTGRYQRSWVVGVNGRNYTGHLQDIPSDAEVLIVNIQPYSRKLEFKGGKVTVRSSLAEDVRQATMKRFPNITAQRAFLTLPASLSTGGTKVPYILKGHAHLAHVVQSRRSLAHRQGRLFHAPSAGTARGAMMTYPAVILTSAAR